MVLYGKSNMDRNVRNLCFVVVVRHVFYINKYTIGLKKNTILSRLFQMVFKINICTRFSIINFVAYSGR